MRDPYSTDFTPVSFHEDKTYIVHTSSDILAEILRLGPQQVAERREEVRTPGLSSVSYSSAKSTSLLSTYNNIACCQVLSSLASRDSFTVHLKSIQ